MNRDFKNNVLEENTQPPGLGFWFPPISSEEGTTFIITVNSSEQESSQSGITHLMASPEMTFSISCWGASKSSSSVRTPPPLNSTSSPPWGREWILYTSAESCRNKNKSQLSATPPWKLSALFIFLTSSNKLITKEWWTFKVLNNVDLVAADLLKCQK